MNKPLKTETIPSQEIMAILITVANKVLADRSVKRRRCSRKVL